LVQEENKEHLLEVKKRVDVKVASFNKIVMEELVYVKKKQVDEASLLKEDIGRSNRLLCKLKWAVVMMMFFLVLNGFSAKMTILG